MEKMYSGTDMMVPWFSTLGNHDFGGRKFNAAWDQQVAYTWSTNSTHRWYLPSLYWHQRVRYPTKNFTVDIFMLDTNKGDAKHWTEDKNHNICGGFNDARNDCSSMGGPKDRFSCADWFKNFFREQGNWLEGKLAQSDKDGVDWQILVTHFPPENFRSWIKPLHIKYGIDLYVGSHRHSQELHLKSWLSGLNYLIAGGGGGITSEFNPGRDRRGQMQYGFFDITINKTHMYLQAINEHGTIVDTGYITPPPGQGEPTCKHYGCNATYADWRACQCTADCWTHAKDWHKENRCCKDYTATCPALASCKQLGCGGKYDWRKPCQCSKGCEKKNNCCSDYNDLCNTPEAQQAEANCAATCEVEGKKGSYPCKDRVDYAVRKQHQKVEDAIDAINTECAGQCNCTAKYYSQGSLLQEAAEDSSEQVEEVEENNVDQDDMEDSQLSEKRTALLEKKIHLEEEL